MAWKFWQRRNTATQNRGPIPRKPRAAVSAEFELLRLVRLENSSHEAPERRRLDSF